MANLRYLLPYMARYRPALLVGLVCAALGAGASALGPYVLRLAVDAIQTGVIILDTLLVYGGLLVFVACIDGAFKFGQRMLIGGTAYRIEFDLRQALFARFMTLDQQFYSRNHTGDLMARATNDLSAVRQFLGPGINGAATALLTLLAAAVLMFSVNVTLTLVVLLLLPMATLVFVGVGSHMRRIFKSVQDQFGDISTRAQENFSGIRTIKAYAQEEAEIGVFTATNDRYRQLNLRYVLLSGALWPSVALIMGGLAALVILVGGRLVAAGTISIGELVQFNAYLGLLSFPMVMMGWLVNLYQQAAASMGRINEVLRCTPFVGDAPDALPITTIRGDVEFRAVGVRFVEETGDDSLKDRIPGSVAQIHRPAPASGWSLRHISFRIPRGTSLAIVGATGAGKTSLVNLLGRVRDPDEGQVLIDGWDVRRLNLSDLRRQIGYVPQETFLFSMPLCANIAFGLVEVHDAALVDGVRLEQAVTTSRLSNDLNQFPEGLDTLIGERGVTLSGGQKQRVAIARALLRDPAILVLDDALSSVDTHTAAQILGGLRAAMRQRTSMIIAQRIATVKDADQIIVLHEGQIIERGTHRELVRQGGRYAAIYRRELLEGELTP